MLCDGRIVCGCADPYATRPFGDCRTQSLADVWNGVTIQTLRTDLNGGGSEFCGDCPLKLPLADGEDPPQRSLDVPPLPSHLFVECTAACNISCFKACCAPETGITRTREAGMLDFELFKRVIDEAGPTLGRVDFFNYGEAFLHKRAVEMCRYIKTHHPHIYLYTSTNGLAFDEAQARQLVHTGIDEVTFSIDGAIQDNYARYRQQGDLEKALGHLATMADEKRRATADVPFLNWRYILFKWNDSDAGMNLARRRATELGVDRLAWEIIDHPDEAFSRRFVPGSPDYREIEREAWDDNNLGNAIPNATPRAQITVRRPLPGLPLVGRSSRQLHLEPKVRNLSSRLFPAQASYGRRLVRLGAQLCAADGSVISRDYARAWLPRTLGPGESAAVPIDIPTPATSGRYALKFDLVFEGVDWFENCGSETTTSSLLVW